MLSQHALLLLTAVIPRALCTAIPSEDASIHPNIPRDFVDRVMASFTTDEDGQLVSRAELHQRTLASRRLEKRAIPSDEACGDAVWVSRYCRSDVGPRQWHDRCLPIDGGPGFWVGGICPVNTYCSEEVDCDDDETIICTPATPPREDNIGSTSRGRKQYGYRTIKPVASVGPSQHLSSIQLLLGINSGSTSGHLGSE
ncbi:hypothetical protein DDE82_005303 [Stemphylium lycopersici]|uniref:Uncharacterized protein n=1 Tax=Stemphylium lycopersici TaxID=183478 RepID=A0A364N886_STELY|nr:hypothetical protein TW65_02012 [Stemphylium lycopersici]RAR03290.1 hypothetical protein DDE82_005303 [Stemphylium lycopersici]RAR13490.1 hypothetical protein DDE83_003086 [Stemphylium lycopersici]